MKVTVLGATGNIGTSVVERLAASPDLEVTAVARREPPPEALGGNVRRLAADVRSADWPRLLAGTDVVVVLSWMFQPARDPETTWQTNVVAMDRLLRALPDTGVRHLVAASSVAAYSPRTSATAVEEDWPTHGASSATYAREKAYVERLLDRAEGSGLRVARLRPAFVFQRRSASEQRRIFAGGHLPAGLLRPGLVRGRLPALPVPRDLLLQTVHADDVADAVQRVVAREATGAFNLCADGVLSGVHLARLLGTRPAYVPDRVVRAGLAAAWRLRALPTEPGLLDALLRVPVMSSARARRELGWEPSRHAESVLAELLEGLDEVAGHPTAPLRAG